MVVHVGEMFTDIRPAESEPGTGAGDRQPSSGRTTEELWDEARGRLTWLRERTAATGFDD
jgi:hypothetical protein